MDGVRELLAAVRDRGLAAGHLRGLLHIAIGRRVTRPDGGVVSTGVTWRELAAALKDLRFDKELVRQVGLDPDGLAPRDRNRFWYEAISAAKVASYEATADAAALADLLRPLGYVVGPPPAGDPLPPPPPPPPPPDPAAKKSRRKK